MTSTKTHPSILYFGLPAHHELNPPQIRDKVAAGLEASQQLADSLGLDWLQLMIPPEAMETDFVAALQSKQWDGVLIGNGIRSTMSLTPYMEKVIVEVRKHAPGAVLLFNTTPDTALDAVRRWFPDVKQA